MKASEPLRFSEALHCARCDLGWGTPEDSARSRDSRTAAYLSDFLRPAQRRRPVAATRDLPTGDRRELR